MTRIRVGGVPEHFNEVWQMALEEKRFEGEDLEVEWVDVKEGTGAMIDKLKSNQLDVVVALTEGLINEIARGSSSIRLIGTYVQSPLLWSVSVKNESSFQSIDDLKGKRFGISRFQSGSHLMSCVLANQFGWKDDDDVHFAVQHHFGNLRAALVAEEIDAFLWEYFMQKPFYDRAEYRHLGSLLTPWPCFLLASTGDFIGAHLLPLQRLFNVLHEQCRRFHLNGENASVSRIASRFSLSPVDAQKWFDRVEIIGENFVSKSTIETTVEALKNARLIANAEQHFDPHSFVDDRLAKLVVDIKSMRLYNKPELLISLRNELRAHRLSKGYIHFTDLLPFDQNHYFGTQVLDIAAEQLRLRAEETSSWIIQIGSSLGGCARYLAGQYSSRLLAVELQNDLSQFGEELTRRCQLDHLVRHLTGNFLHLAEHLQENFYSSIVSWLTILHFNEDERKELFQQSFRLIRPGGHFFLEDFIRIDRLSDEERSILENDVFCQYLPLKDEYLRQLSQAGFDVVSTDDLTSPWKEFTHQRAEQFQKNRDELVAVHGEDLFSRLSFFYRSIEQLFQGNHVGGIRILARKPPLPASPSS